MLNFITENMGTVFMIYGVLVFSYQICKFICGGAKK